MITKVSIIDIYDLRMNSKSYLSIVMKNLEINIMKISSALTILLSLFGLSISSCHVSKNQPKATMSITGTINQTEMYCGGAAPPEELLNKLRQPHPLKNYKFYIKEGLVNDLDSKVFATVKTDENGYFQLELPAGKYILLTAEQLTKSIISNPGENIKIVYQDKLNTWWREGIALIKVDTKEIEVTLHKRCYLPIGVIGLRYTGPVAE